MLIHDMTSLPELVEEAAKNFGENPALDSTNPSGSRLTYFQLFEHVQRGASTLLAKNLAAGERVLLSLKSQPEWAAAFFSILAAGLVAVPIPANTTPEASVVIATHAQTKAAIFSDQTKHLVAELEDIKRIPLKGLFQADRALKKELVNDRRTLAVLAFTSGSTRQPRAVELTHENLLCNLDALLQVRHVSQGDTFLSLLPPAHLFELMGGLLGPVACGVRIVYASSLLPNRIIKALREHEITHALAVPALIGCLYEEVFNQLIEAGAIDAKRKNESLAELTRRIQAELSEEELHQIRSRVRSQIGATFRTLIVGGAAVDLSMVKIVEALGIRTEVGYGLTEASPVVSVGFVGECPAGSVGRPLPGVKVRIDEHGEILIRGPNVMQGYFKDPLATEAVLKDGWLKTGDHGRMDKDGFLFVTGRLKEVMVTAAGETIYPEEVEPYYQNSLFSELCVVGLRGKDGNDLPTLVVVPATQDVPEQDLEDTFASLRAAAPARFRVERTICLTHALPRTSLGKVRRRFLAQELNHHEV
ncbi:MAG: AMP-binding protein [Planctomycetes bacterium]|nr:AMP-binding protein [Planctomycetota bacterium]